uniref:Wsv415-like protein n=1 Tax=Metapenaeus ensis majanivirus TaxID=2984279 RepID=A0A9C7C8P4_9VIRU|nr:MAG: wsv415-like protein [Metapenaeus ensis majanivirus]
MSFISLKLLNNLYNHRERLNLYRHLVNSNNDAARKIDTKSFTTFNITTTTTTTTTTTSCNSKGNNYSSDSVMYSNYHILSIDPLCPANQIYVKVKIKTFIPELASPFLAALLDAAYCYVEKKNIGFIENVDNGFDSNNSSDSSNNSSSSSNSNSSSSNKSSNSSSSSSSSSSSNSKNRAININTIITTAANNDDDNNNNNNNNNNDDANDNGNAANINIIISTLPLDTKTVYVPLSKLCEIIQKFLFNASLKKEHIITSLFSINRQDYIDIVHDFFAFDTYSKCILFLLYIQLLLECVPSSSIKFYIVDVYTNELVKIKRKCHVTQLSKENNKNQWFLEQNYNKKQNVIDRILKYIVEPVVDPPPPSSSSSSSFENSNVSIVDNSLLHDIIRNARVANYIATREKKEEKENEMDLIGIENMTLTCTNNHNNYTNIILRIRKEPRLINSNKQILFPTFIGQQNQLQFLKLSDEAKTILLLPHFFQNYSSLSSCLYGHSTLLNNQTCTFLMADFLPIMNI